MQPPRKPPTRTLIRVLALAAILLSAAPPHAARADDDAAAAPSRLVTLDGQTALKLDPATRRANAITVATLHPAPWQDHVRAYATVLDPTPLADAANALAAARAVLLSAQARLAASQTAYRRAGILYRGQQNISLAQLQAAEAAWRTDTAALASASTEARMQSLTAAERFGPLLANALGEGSPLIDQLLERHQFLIRITLPPGAEPLPTPPPAATLLDASGKASPIRFLSPASTVDPRTQSIPLFYLAPVASGVLPGMNLLALLPSGPVINGLAVPASAIVWLQGSAWFYRELRPDLFVRTRLAIDGPTTQGVATIRASDVAANAPVVTEGAQSLLSEEFRAQIQSDDD